MARYRFRWDNLPEHLVHDLGHQLGPSSDPIDVLRKAYGARPKGRFIAEQWSMLLNSWLPAAPKPLDAIAVELQVDKLGRWEMAIDSVDTKLDYLRTCRNTSRLQQIVLKQFIRAGEGDLTPLPTSRPAQPDSPPIRIEDPSIPVNGPATLSDFVAESLKARLGLTELVRDDDGDFPVRQGSALCFVRVEEEAERPSRIVVFSHLVEGVARSPELLESLNEINLQLPLGRVMHTDEMVILAAELLADTLSPQELNWALDFMSQTSDLYDSKLVSRYGGHARFSDEETDNVEV